MTDDFPPDAALRRRLARDEPLRGGQDRGSHPAQHLGQPVAAGVDAPAGLRDALEIGDDALAVAAELELDHERVEALALLDTEVADVALLLEDASDLLLQPRGRHFGALVPRSVRVANPRQHVC